jgi:large subunit ribosomal protein L15
MITKKLIPIVKKRKKLGRGIGSGRGKTCGKGTKGQTSRTGGKVNVGFEGGQTPVFRRFPKIGPRKQKPKKNYIIVNLDNLEKNQKITNSQTLDFSESKNLVKILGGSTMKKKMIIRAHSFSKGAIKSIQKNGGDYEILKFRGKS